MALPIETIAKALCRSLHNNRELGSVDASIDEATRALAVAMQEGWIDRNMELKQKGHEVAVKSRAGKTCSRANALFV